MFVVRQDPARPVATLDRGVPVPLGQTGPGFRGTIHAIDANAVRSSLPAEELERRLIEIGLVEGARVEVRHQGLIRRDPIAVRVNGHATFALRRREAAAVLVVADAPAA
jgi:ferrous iron transport protein A